jgi:glycine/D-amino acid oxidase-like deaminating enzyme
MLGSTPHSDSYDAVIIGGGFFGCCLALSMVNRYPRMLILEKENALLARASYGNQARVHNGYHYPRSLITAMRSAFNYPRFLADFEDCIDRTFLQVYAIARGTSRSSAYQYKKFCELVGIPLKSASKQVERLFNPALIEEAFAVEECAFDALRLRQKLRAGIEEAGIEVAYGVSAERISSGPAGSLRIETSGGAEVHSERVWNCAYSGINQLLTRSALPPLPLKHEIAEIALIRVPPALEGVGITVMDGPFFSTMPFPALGLHSLTHVTYTPHESWNDLEENRCAPQSRRLPSKSIFMLRDAQRYVPALRSAICEGSLFETKTVLLRNEVDDGRPILCRRDYGLKNLSVILGAKIDNIYDVLKAFDPDACFPWSKHEFNYPASPKSASQKSVHVRAAGTQ